MDQSHKDSQVVDPKRLAELDQIQSDILSKPPPMVDLLQVEVTGEGHVHAIKRDRLTHAVTAGLVSALVRNGWYRRDGTLVKEDLTGNRIDVPVELHFEAIHSIKYCAKQEIEWRDPEGKLKRRTVWQPCDSLKNIESLLDQVDMRQVTGKVFGSPNIKELVFANEPPPTNNTHCPSLDPKPATTDLELSAKSRAENTWSAWLKFMDKHCTEQLNFFDLLGHAHAFAARTTGNYVKHIHVGVGPNGGGKGTLIRMLDSVLGFAAVKTFTLDDASAEYRADQIFDSRSPLMGCHEWRFEKNSKIDAFIGAMKSATRGEAVNVRGVGKAAQAVRPRCAFFLFYNSPSGANRLAALEDTYRKMSDWDAYDRVNVAYVDWAHVAQRLAPEMFTELMWALDNAKGWLGLCVRRYFEDMDTDTLADKTNFIPMAYRFERASILYEAWQTDLLRAAEIAASMILNLADYTGTLTHEAKTEFAIGATLQICDVLQHDPPVGSQWFLERSPGDWYCYLPASQIQSSILGKRAPKHWQKRLTSEFDGVFAGSETVPRVTCPDTDTRGRVLHLITSTESANRFLLRLIDA